MKTTIAIVAVLAVAAGAFAQDSKKRIAEMTTETVLEESGAVPLPAPKTAENPTVAPGLVRWHTDLATARAASRDSEKPVLLFQLLGRLDREFC